MPVRHEKPKWHFTTRLTTKSRLQSDFGGQAWKKGISESAFKIWVSDNGDIPKGNAPDDETVGQIKCRKIKGFGYLKYANYNAYYNKFVS